MSTRIPTFSDWQNTLIFSLIFPVLFPFFQYFFQQISGYKLFFLFNVAFNM